MIFIKKLLLFFAGTFLTLGAHNLTVIWQTKANWERDWLNELLSDFTVTSIDDCNYQVCQDNSIIVLSSVHNFQGHHEYFEKLKALHYKFGVILLSDERYKAPTDFYQYAQFVFRNYWHKKFVGQKNVYIFPLGYKRGFWQHVEKIFKKPEERKYLWSFAGQITKKPTREAMIQAMKQIPNYHIHETFAWACPHSLSVDSYRDLLLDTVFAPCPTGWWNLDSFRVYEALECGCIPIVEKNPLDYFGLYFGKHPFLVVDSWNQAPELINALLANKSLLEERMKACHTWWQAHKEKVKKEWHDVICNSGIVTEPK